MSEAARKREEELLKQGYKFVGLERRADGKMYRAYVKQEVIVQSSISAKLEAMDRREHLSGAALGQWDN